MGAIAVCLVIAIASFKSFYTIQNFGRFSDCYNSPINLAMNYKIILSMFAAAQSQEEIKLAVKAAGILRYNEYIEPLKLIASKSTDDELQQEIFEVIDQIIKDPMKRNPKWDVD